MWKGLVSDRFIDPHWRVPALRPNRAEMSRAAFLGLIVVWSGAVTSMLCVAIVVRLFG
jgi:hypothetical protein